MINNPSLPIYSIYRITNLVNQKKYIGFTSQNPPNKRLKTHHQKSSNPKCLISKAIQKNGKDNFKFEIILQGKDKSDVLSMETYFINEYNTLSPNGYNMTTGGEHYKFSAETKKKLANKRNGKICWNKGKKHSEETKLKISLSKRGKNNPMYGKPSAMKGKKHSEETKLKMSKSYKGFKNKTHSEISKKKMKRKYNIELPNNNIIEILGITEFCKKHDMNPNLLRYHSKLNSKFKGFKIIY